jgi:hypothetical protein
MAAMKKNILLLCLLLPVSVFTAIAQTGSVSGVVTDSLTGQPVVNLTVFIPNTTMGTTTDQQGNYHLNKVNPGDYILMFRHLSYPSVSRPIAIEPGKNIVLNLVIAEKPQRLAEVTVVGRLPDRRAAFHLFQQYFLGDATEFKCKLENPAALSFHFDGNTLKATAKEPLIITNRHLGYRITFFLDYFQCIDYRSGGFHYDFSGNFGYSGYALFEDLTAAQPLMSFVWKINRNNEFKGSLRQFLACLCRNELNTNRYFVRRAFHGPGEIQLAGKLSTAMTRIRLAQMDSIASWNHVTGKPDVLLYDPDEEYVFSGAEVGQGTLPVEKSLSTDALLLVFRDYKKTKELSDDFISILRIPKGGITFDRDGNFRTKGGEVQWVNLDNAMQVKRLLPYDYIK